MGITDVAGTASGGPGGSVRHPELAQIGARGERAMEWELGEDDRKEARPARAVLLIGDGRRLRENAAAWATGRPGKGAWHACSSAGASWQMRPGAGWARGETGGGSQNQGRAGCAGAEGRSRVAVHGRSGQAAGLERKGAWRKNAGERAQSVSQGRKRKRNGMSRIDLGGWIGN